MDNGREAAADGPETPTTPVAPRRREAHPRRLLLIIVAVSAVVLAIVYSRVQNRRAALLRTQQACLTYQRPAEMVVYEEPPARAAELLKQGGEYMAFATGESGEVPVAGHVPAVWQAMRRWALPEAAEPRGAVLFLHERQTAAGQRGLVCVEADRAARRLSVTFIHPGASSLDPAPIINVQVAPPPKEGLIILAGGGDPFESKLPPRTGESSSRADLRFFAGQPDATNPTHFTLPYELNSRRGTIEMWVHDDRTIHYGDHLVNDR